MKYAIILLLSLASTLWLDPALADEPEAAASLYQRLGEMEGIESIVSKTVELHMVSPEISAYVKHIDREWLIDSVTAFFAAGTGGPNNYTGTDMATAHAHLNLTNREFDLAVADVLASLSAHDIDADSYAEVNNILQSMRDAVVSGE